MAAPERIDLFNGKDLSNWTKRDGSPAGNWIVEDGVYTVVDREGDIVSKETFGDAMIHVEFRVPDMPDKEGQDKGNSGVFVHGRYEVQVLDSYDREVPGYGDCSSLYDRHAALFNNCKKAMEWQTYDIIFRAPRFDADGKLTEFPRITVMHNGLPVHNNLVMERMTGAPLTEEMVAEGPLLLQDHGNAVSFRNVWICKLPPKGADKY
ncbi:MAG: DUF1080 domain-containing protein [Clostridia bacterium]|nr:DUF1080 domain-containing protein [Clostridia bacterium]